MNSLDHLATAQKKVMKKKIIQMRELKALQKELFLLPRILVKV
jgi:hypothetical protein